MWSKQPLLFPKKLHDRPAAVQTSALALGSKNAAGDSQVQQWRLKLQIVAGGLVPIF
jgi:hypothetical protein